MIRKYDNTAVHKHQLGGGLTDTHYQKKKEKKKD